MSVFFIPNRSFGIVSVKIQICTRQIRVYGKNVKHGKSPPAVILSSEPLKTRKLIFKEPSPRSKRRRAAFAQSKFCVSKTAKRDLRYLIRVIDNFS